MTAAFEDLETLKAAEIICDNLWQRIVHWGPFARDTVGQQLVDAADSIGANIAEAYGQLAYGEKVAFLYDARGSLFETKYWINRARTRELLENETALAYAAELANLARQINTLLAVTRQQRPQESSAARAVREDGSDYSSMTDPSKALFSPHDLAWLGSADI